MFPQTNFFQNVEDKFMKLSKIGFSMKCFTADFPQYFSTEVNICLLADQLATHFRDFLEISNLLRS